MLSAFARAFLSVLHVFRFTAGAHHKQVKLPCSTSSRGGGHRRYQPYSAARVKSVARSSGRLIIGVLQTGLVILNASFVGSSWWSASSSSSQSWSIKRNRCWKTGSCLMHAGQRRLQIFRRLCRSTRSILKSTRAKSLRCLVITVRANAASSSAFLESLQARRRRNLFGSRNIVRSLPLPYVMLASRPSTKTSRWRKISMWARMSFSAKKKKKLFSLYPCKRRVHAQRGRQSLGSAGYSHPVA